MYYRIDKIVVNSIINDYVINSRYIQLRLRFKNVKLNKEMHSIVVINHHLNIVKRQKIKYYSYTS